MEHDARRGARVAIAVEVDTMALPLPVLSAWKLAGVREPERLGKKLLQVAPGWLVTIGSRCSHGSVRAMYTSARRLIFQNLALLHACLVSVTLRSAT